jgi:hypothetical protein
MLSNWVIQHHVRLVSWHHHHHHILIKATRSMVKQLQPTIYQMKNWVYIGSWNQCRTIDTNIDVWSLWDNRCETLSPQLHPILALWSCFSFHYNYFNQPPVGRNTEAAQSHTGELLQSARFDSGGLSRMRLEHRCTLLAGCFVRYGRTAAPCDGRARL